MPWSAPPPAPTVGRSGSPSAWSRIKGTARPGRRSRLSLGSRSCSSYRSATEPDWPNWSTPRGTHGTPSAEPIQASVCEAASCTVTTGARNGNAARNAPACDGVVAVRTPCRSVRCHALYIRSGEVRSTTCAAMPSSASSAAAAITSGSTRPPGQPGTPAAPQRPTRPGGTPRRALGGAAPHHPTGTWRPSRRLVERSGGQPEIVRAVLGGHRGGRFEGPGRDPAEGVAHQPVRSAVTSSSI